MDKEDKKVLKHRLKEIPESHVKQLIDLIGLVGIEHDIAMARIINKKSVQDICDELNISEGTYHRAFNIILAKMSMMLNCGTEVNTNWFMLNK